MSRRTLINLVVFLGVFVVMCIWAVNNIITIDSIDQPYTIKADFTASAGVKADSEVAYLGVHYGRVSAIERVPGGVDMTLKIDRGKQIPLNSVARIFRKSAIGEPYIDFKPPTGYTGDGGPFLQPGETVPVTETTTPLEFSELLRSASALLANIQPEKAGDLIHELSLALDGRGDDLRSLTQSFDKITTTFAAKTDVLDRLATNNTTLTHVFATHADDFGSSVTNLRLLADALASSSGDTQVLLDQGTQLIGQLANIVGDQKGNLDCTLKALTNVTDITTAHVGGLSTLLTTGPQAFNEFSSTLDNEPDGVWARVNLLVSTQNPAPQYSPPLSLPAHRPVPECGSPLVGTGPDFVPSAVLAQSQTSTPSLPSLPGGALGNIFGALGLGVVLVPIVVPRARRS